MYIVRIYHKFEGRIEKSVPGIAVWHHGSCRVMTNDDPEGRIFYPTLTQIVDFLLLTAVFIYLFFFLFILK